MIFGVAFFASFVEIFLSRVINKMKSGITPVTTGITTIGMSLIKVGMTDLAGGFGNPDIGAAKFVIVGVVVLGSVDLLSSFLQQFVWGFYKAEPMWCSWLDNSSCIILMSYIPVAIHE
ncbi:hypothetical protein ACMAZF_11595 [Psychrobium sp. nBUS_13]|uniref:hypothetical protein n=1 Tax=Psychrobium sp. nBUS_13 TaxID=3395319 RepID=UPI003EBF0D49